jgi:hypothetical protein
MLGTHRVVGTHLIPNMNLLCVILCPQRVRSARLFTNRTIIHQPPNYSLTARLFADRSVTTGNHIPNLKYAASPFLADSGLWMIVPRWPQETVSASLSRPSFNVRCTTG